MHKLLLSLLVALMPLLASAQQLRYGYLSLDGALKALPAYAQAEQQLADLRGKYDAEMKRVELEFNQKYEAFLEGQRDFAPSILRKRQQELQDLMQKNVAFKQQAERLLDEARQSAIAPLKARVRQAVARAAEEQGLSFVLNTDNDAVPYTSDATGVDLTQRVATLAAEQ